MFDLRSVGEACANPKGGLTTTVDVEKLLVRIRRPFFETFRCYQRKIANIHSHK